jgi:hypothetical protein
VGRRRREGGCKGRGRVMRVGEEDGGRVRRRGNLKRDEVWS